MSSLNYVNFNFGSYKRDIYEKYHYDVCSGNTVFGVGDVDLLVDQDN